MMICVMLICFQHLPVSSLIRQACKAGARVFDILRRSGCADRLMLIIHIKSRTSENHINYKLFIVCHCCVSFKSNNIWRSATALHQLQVEKSSFEAFSFRRAILAAQSNPRRRTGFAFKIKRNKHYITF